MNLEQLATQIAQVHDVLYKKATSAVNISLTIRNWFIGHYIVEYEQHGEDRAKYGEKLFKNLSSHLKDKGLKNVHERELRRFRQFYKVYYYLADILFDNKSEIRGSVPPILPHFPIRGGSAPRISKCKLNCSTYKNSY